MTRNKLLAAAVAGALMVVGVNHFTGTQNVVPAAQAATNPETHYGLPDFTELVVQASPAVVSIQVTKAMPTGLAAQGRTFPPGMGPGSPEFEFFRRFGPPPGGDEGPVQRGQGSGFIISADGYVLTNAHVVENADEVSVLLADKREIKAKVVGIDDTTDVAVLKLPEKNLPTLKVGDANALKVGEWVIAIGSPFGFDHTVSAGVVSAKTRALPNGGYVPFIQTDVALNPGNSGGPLLNLRGEVVGMNSQIYSRSGGYMGLSFAIPIDLAMNVQNQLVAHGKVTRGRIGVTVQSLNQQLADSFGLPRPMGALVGAVQPGFAAHNAGIKPGDVIVAVNGQAIEDSALLSRLIAEQTPGRDVTLEIIRNGKRRTMDVKLGAADGDVAALEDAAPANDKPGRLGVVARELDSEARDEAGTTQGVLVERAEGAAARAGVRAGDIILAVNSNRVGDLADLKTLIDQAPGQIALLVRREDTEIYIPVTLG